MFWFGIGLFVIVDLLIIRHWLHELRHARVVRRNDFERRRQQSIDSLAVAHRFERKARSTTPGVVLSMEKGRAS